MDNIFRSAGLFLACFLSHVLIVPEQEEEEILGDNFPVWPNSDGAEEL
ncbi:MAG: hypothetical protein GX606_04635 [Elusimicrobia bacterium]|nr:hypothetical protein [Elusimicrobiota bacterium]